MLPRPSMQGLSRIIALAVLAVLAAFVLAAVLIATCTPVALNIAAIVLGFCLHIAYGRRRHRSRQ